MKKILWILSLLFLNACSNTASIHMADGRVYEGRISNGDAEFIYTALPYVTNDQFTQTPIKRSEIVDIDHPGNVHLLLGSIFSAFGVLSTGLAIAAFQSNDPWAQEVMGIQMVFNSVVYLGVGVPMGIWGWNTWQDSKNAMNSEYEASPNRGFKRLLLVPVIKEDRQKANFGLSLLVDF